MKTRAVLFSTSFFAFVVSLVVSGAVATAGPNPLNVVRVYPSYTAMVITRDLMRQFGQVPANYLPTAKTVKGSKSNADNIAMPGDWEVTITTTEGIRGKMFYAQRPIFRLNEAAQSINRPSRDFPVDIDEPGIRIKFDQLGLGGYAIKEQGIKLFAENGVELSILSSTMRLVLVPGSNNIVEIKEMDPRPFIPIP